MNKRDDGTGGGGGGGRARADATKDLYRNLSGLGLKSVTSSQLANLAYIKVRARGEAAQALGPRSTRALVRRMPTAATLRGRLHVVCEAWA